MNHCKNIFVLSLTMLAMLHGSYCLAAGEQDRYLGFTYTLVELEDDAIRSDEAETSAVIMRLGRFFNDYLSFEGRLGDGFDSGRLEGSIASGDDIDLDVDTEIDYLLGAYGLLHSNRGGDLSWYALLGITRVKFIGESESGAIEVVADESGLSYGFGVDIQAFNLELIQYLDDDGFDIPAFSIGFSVRF